jgi:hypothetical protein
MVSNQIKQWRRELLMWGRPMSERRKLVAWAAILRVVLEVDEQYRQLSTEDRFSCRTQLSFIRRKFDVCFKSQRLAALGGEWEAVGRFVTEQKTLAQKFLQEESHA